MAFIGGGRLFEPHGLLVAYPELPAEPIALAERLDRDATAAVLEFFLCHRFHLQIHEDSILNHLDTSPDRVRAHDIQAVQMAAQHQVNYATAPAGL